MFLDSGSADHDATYNSGLRYQRGHRPGSKAVADLVDAALATIGDVYRFAVRQPFTVLGLHYWTGGGTANNTILDKRNPAVTAGWCLGYSSGSAWLGRIGGGDIVGAAARLNDWNLVVGAYDGNNLIIYINGQYATQADANNCFDSNTPLQINSFPGGGGAYGAHGRFDTCAIWDGVVLTQAEMDAIWDVV